MKLRNKKTGDVFDFDSITDLCFGSKIQLQATNMHNKPIYIFNSLAALNEEWEDYQEPLIYWFIDEFGLVQQEQEYFYEDNKEAVHDKRKEIGNYFETKEEAERAVKKLEAWKRLRDKGFKFDGWETTIDTKTAGEVHTTFNLWDNLGEETTADVDLLFGGEDGGN